MRQRGLAAARGAPEDHRAGGAALDGIAERLPGPEQMLLAHELVERRGRIRAASGRVSAPGGEERCFGRATSVSCGI